MGYALKKNCSTKSNLFVITELLLLLERQMTTCRWEFLHQSLLITHSDNWEHYSSRHRASPQAAAANLLQSPNRTSLFVCKRLYSSGFTVVTVISSLETNKCNCIVSLVYVNVVLTEKNGGQQSVTVASLQWHASQLSVIAPVMDLSCTQGGTHQQKGPPLFW